MTTDGLVPETVSQIVARLAVNEGMRLRKYADSVGIPTIGIGFNLTRPDAEDCLHAVGVADPSAVIAGAALLTRDQATRLMENDLPHFINGARDVLPEGVFNALTPPRQAAIVDLSYNLGPEGLAGFPTFLGLIASAQHAKAAGDVGTAHADFVAAGDDLNATAYAAQVGDRARRNAAMIVTGAWVSPTGDGSC